MNDDLVSLHQFDGKARLFPLPNVVLFQNVNLWAASTNVHNFVAPPDDRMELHDVYLQ